MRVGVLSQDVSQLITEALETFSHIWKARELFGLLKPQPPEVLMLVREHNLVIILCHPRQPVGNYLGSTKSLISKLLLDFCEHF